MDLETSPKFLVVNNERVTYYTMEEKEKNTMSDGNICRLATKQEVKCDKIIPKLEQSNDISQPSSTQSTVQSILSPPNQTQNLDLHSQNVIENQRSDLCSLHHPTVSFPIQDNHTSHFQINLKKENIQHVNDISSSGLLAELSASLPQLTSEGQIRMGQHEIKHGNSMPTKLEMEEHCSFEQRLIIEQEQINNNPINEHLDNDLNNQNNTLLNEIDNNIPLKKVDFIIHNIQQFTDNQITSSESPKNKEEQIAQSQSVFFLKGLIQVDMNVLSLAGDNIERTNPKLMQCRENIFSPFSVYRNSVQLIRFARQGYSEVLLEESKKPFKDLDYLYSQLLNKQTVIAYANIQAIQQLQKHEGTQKEKRKEALAYFQIEKGSSEQNPLHLIVEKHYSDAQQSRRKILSMKFSNKVFLYIIKRNRVDNLKDTISHYGLSDQFEKIAFSSDKSIYSYNSLHNGLFHPYHDNYSHLQHFLVHLLNYQDRQVKLRTYDNYTLNASLRRFVITLNQTPLEGTKFVLTTTMFLHQFLIDENQMSGLLRRQITYTPERVTFTKNDLKYAEKVALFMSKYYDDSEKNQFVKRQRKQLKTCNSSKGISHSNTLNVPQTQKLEVLQGVQSNQVELLQNQ